MRARLSMMAVLKLLVHEDGPPTCERISESLLALLRYEYPGEYGLIKDVILKTLREREDQLAQRTTCVSLTLPAVVVASSLIPALLLVPALLVEVLIPALVPVALWRTPLIPALGSTPKPSRRSTTAATPTTSSTTPTTSSTTRLCLFALNLPQNVSKLQPFLHTDLCTAYSVQMFSDNFFFFFLTTIYNKSSLEANSYFRNWTQS